jgi:hypothetical protein
LGPLEPWQQKLFEEEALPEYQRFMRGYRLSSAPAGAKGGASSQPAITADIDFENLKDFLKFYAPKSLKRDKPPIYVYLKSEMPCFKCSASLPGLKALVTERLERRGFKIIWGSPADLSDPKAMGPKLDAVINAVALQKKAVGSLLLSWHHAVNEEDPSHPDTRDYSIRSLLDIRDISKSQAKIVLPETGSFEVSAGKLLTDAFTQLGARASDLEITQSELKREELIVDVIGIKSFASYQAVKDALQSSLQLATVEDQKISRGRAIFSVFSDASIEKVQQSLSTVKMPGMKFGPATVEGNQIHLEVLATEDPANAIKPTSAIKSQNQPAASAPAKPADDKKGDPEA